MEGMSYQSLAIKAAFAAAIFTVVNKCVDPICEGAANLIVAGASKVRGKRK